MIDNGGFWRRGEGRGEIKGETMGRGKGKGERKEGVKERERDTLLSRGERMNVKRQNRKWKG